MSTRDSHGDYRHRNRSDRQRKQPRRNMTKDGNNYSANSYQNKAPGDNQFWFDMSPHPHIDRGTDHGTCGVKCKKKTKLSFCVVVLIILPHFLLNKIHEISRICLNKLPVGPRQEKHHWESDLGPLCLVVATGKLRQLGKTALIAFGSWGFAPEVGFLRHKRAANIRPIDHHVTGDQ